MKPFILLPGLWSWSWSLVSGLSPGLCVFQEVKQYYEDYQQMKQEQREEAEAEQEVAPRKHFHILFVMSVV